MKVTILFSIWACAFLPLALSWDDKYKNHGCVHTMEEPEFFKDPYCNKNAYCKNMYNAGAFYDEIGKECIMSLGGFCAYRSEEMKCPPNAICSHNCECGPKFIEVNGTCILGKSHQENCSEGQGSTQSCDERAGLKCRNGKCTCTEDGIVGAWNPYEFKCIPARCDNSENNNASPNCTTLLSTDVTRYSTFFAKCPPNSQFVDNWRGYEEGQCKCESGFEESANHFECVRGKKHGEICSLEQPCDEETLGLECTEGTCACKSGGVYNQEKETCYSFHYCNINFGQTFFDVNLASCIAKINRQCNPNSTDDESCPTNAKCTQPYEWDKGRFICKCLDGYVATDDWRKCYQAKHYGENCEIDGELDPCSKTEKLTCSKESSTCGCGENEEWNGKECKFLVGHRCSAFNCRVSYCHGDNCANHQYCSNTNYVGNDGVCECHSGYSPVSRDDGHCLGEFFSRCKTTEECHNGMKCLDGQCKCTDSLISKYDQKKKFCIVSTGGKCSRNEVCTENANCLDGRCQCKDGYSKTDFGECMISPLGHGEKCEAGKCDLKQGLACESGTCSCIWDTMTFVPGEGCLTPLGERCGFIGVNPKCLENSDECKFYTVGCEGSAICKEISPGLSQCSETVSKVAQPSAPTSP